MEGVGYLSKNEDLFRKTQGTGWRSVIEEELLVALEATLRKYSTQKRNAYWPSWAIPISNLDNMTPGVGPVPSLRDLGGSSRLPNDARKLMYRNMAQGNSGREVQNEAGGSILRSVLNTAKRDPTTFKKPEVVKLLVV
ncbi:hypothetical protein F5Y08DRAFT_303799, partial [Xylaria arbuscula]